MPTPVQFASTPSVLPVAPRDDKSGSFPEIMQALSAEDASAQPGVPVAKASDSQTLSRDKGVKPSSTKNIKTTNGAAKDVAGEAPVREDAQSDKSQKAGDECVKPREVSRADHPVPEDSEASADKHKTSDASGLSILVATPVVPVSVIASLPTDSSASATPQTLESDGTTDNSVLTKEKQSSRRPPLGTAGASRFPGAIYGSAKNAGPATESANGPDATINTFAVDKGGANAATGSQVFQSRQPGVSDSALNSATELASSPVPEYRNASAAKTAYAQNFTGSDGKLPGAPTVAGVSVPPTLGANPNKQPAREDLRDSAISPSVPDPVALAGNSLPSTLDRSTQVVRSAPPLDSMRAATEAPQPTGPEAKASANSPITAATQKNATVKTSPQPASTVGEANVPQVASGTAPIKEPTPPSQMQPVPEMIVEKAAPGDRAPASNTTAQNPPVVSTPPSSRRGSQTQRVPLNQSSVSEKADRTNQRASSGSVQKSDDSSNSAQSSQSSDLTTEAHGKSEQPAFAPQSSPPGRDASATQNPHATGVAQASLSPGHSTEAANNAPPATSATPANPETAQEPRAYTLVESARLIECAASTEMRVGVHTPELGKVEVHATLRDNGVGATLTVDRPEVQRMLAAELPSLSRALDRQQVELQSVSLMSSTASDSGSQGREPQQQPQRQAWPQGSETLSKPQESLRPNPATSRELGSSPWVGSGLDLLA